MKVQFELTIGENKFTLIEDVDSHSDLIKKFSFYSSLPKTGPNGETDLVLQHRVAKSAKGPVDYFSIVSQKAKQEFKFGQNVGGNGKLFPKGWEPLYNAGKTDDEEGGESVGPSMGIGGGIGGGIGNAAPAPQAAAPSIAPAASVGIGGINIPTPAPRAATPTPTPTPAAPAPAAPAANPAVANQAASVLSKFGL